MRWLAIGGLLAAATIAAGTASAQTTSSSVAPAAAARPAPPPPAPPPATAPDAGRAHAAAPDAGIFPRARPLPPVRKVRVPQQHRGRSRPLGKAPPKTVDAVTAADPLDAGVAPAPAPAEAVARPRSVRTPGAVGEAPVGLPTELAPEPSESLSTLVLWLLLIGAVLLATRTADVVLTHWARRGWVPVLLRLFATGMRGLALVLALIMLADVAPGLGRHWPWLLAAMAGLLVFAGRDVLRDVFAHLVLRLEGQVRVGQRIETEVAEGEVARVGLRATRVRDSAGRNVDVPNHLLLTAPLRADPEHRPSLEIELRLPEGDGVGLRRALVDTVRASPWVPIDGEVSVRRDAMDPGRWLIRADVLDPQHAQRFEGELAEQVEARLRAEAELSSRR